jgi:hypothetical protein
MRTKSAESRLNGVLCLNLNLRKNEPQTGRRPIEGTFMFLIKIC